MPWAFLARPRLALTAIAMGDRVEVTARVRDAFIEAGAFLVDVHFFSGLQTTFGFEVDARKLGALEAALDGAGLRLDDEGRTALRAAKTHEGEITGTLAVTFAHGDPRLRHEVPSVPG